MTKIPDNETEEEALARREKAAAYMRGRRQHLKAKGIAPRPKTEEARKISLAANKRSKARLIAAETPEQAVERKAKAAAYQRKSQAKLDREKAEAARARGEKPPRTWKRKVHRDSITQDQTPSALAQPRVDLPSVITNTTPLPKTITVLTRNALRHGPFVLSLSLLRSRSSYISTKCLDLFDRHHISSAITPGPPLELTYQISLPETEWHIFAAYAYMVMTGELELDFRLQAPPLRGVDDAWDRLVELGMLCEGLEDVEGMKFVTERLEEHVGIDFPGRDGVRRAFSALGKGGWRDVVRRVLVDEVVEGSEERDVLGVLNEVGCKEFEREVLMKLLRDREERGWEKRGWEKREGRNKRSCHAER